MNGRTCQLCGKPLSRFTVGSGGEFCSREHRNQFRLRTGMDRLLEANKVASLMRRRENAKSITAAQLSADCKASPRSAPHLRIPTRLPATHSLLPGPAALGTARLSSEPGTLQPQRPATALVRKAEAAKSAGPFVSQQKHPLLRPRSDRFPVQIAAAGAVIPRFPDSRTTQGARHMALTGHMKPRTHFGVNGIQVRPLPAGTGRCTPEPQRARRLISSADRGRPLRISGGIGFRLTAARIRGVTFTGPQATPLLNATRARNIAAISGTPAGASRTAVIPRTIRGLFGPEPPAQDNAVEFQWPTAIQTGGSVPCISDADARSCRTLWKVPAPLIGRPQFRNGVTHLPPTAGARMFARPAACQIDSVSRLTLVAFEPQDAPFEHSPSSIHGTLVGGMQFPSTAIRSLDASSGATLQEHFDNGWNNWLGGTDDWKVDAAGVRTGSLALFSPSLEMADYDLEFLARIENRSVNWVFRAADFNDYYVATLTAIKGGGYELQHSAVIGGTPEAAVAAPVTIAVPGPARTALTIRVRAAGSQFTISLDGKVVDTWTDSRLAAGGIGFVSAPEDGARLYWVKITPAEHISKESRKS